MNSASIAAQGFGLGFRLLLLSGLVGYLNLNVYLKSLIVSSMSSPQASERLRTAAELVEVANLELGIEVPILMTLMEMRWANCSS